MDRKEYSVFLSGHLMPAMWAIDIKRLLPLLKETTDVRIMYEDKYICMFVNPLEAIEICKNLD